jgi:hypothetical protein
MAGYDVHLVGSIPLSNATEVFETVGALLGPRLPRIPDGETGARTEWMGWLEPFFAEHPQMENTGEKIFRGYWSYKYRVKPGVPVESVRFDNLNHADIAIASYREFARLKAAGKVPAHCRFQFAIAHPITPIWRFIAEDQQTVLGPRYQEALLAQVAKMTTAIPHQEFAIQWDCASQIFRTLQEGKPTRYGSNKAEMLQRLARWCIDLGEAIPSDVDLVYHLCYGSAQNRHSVEPVDMGDMVDMANLITAGLSRPLQVFHMPVPMERSDDAYFEPLKRLRLKPPTRLSIGCVHFADGVAGTRRRLATAEKFASDFLIATECGFGRYPAEAIPKVLDVHAELAGLR